MTAPIVATGGIAVLSFILGITFFTRSNSRWHDLGVGLLTGTSTAFLLLMLQVSLDQAQVDADKRAEQERDAEERIAKQQDREAAKRAAEEAFLLQLSLSANLTGFDPQARSLQDAYLSGKTLVDAHFEDADLRGAQLRNSNLTAADLDDADLRGANLLFARLRTATLRRADLRGADLRGAKFSFADVWSARLDGAIVDARTCWPRSFLRTRAPKAGFVVMPVRTERRSDPPSLGHVCERG